MWNIFWYFLSFTIFDHLRIKGIKKKVSWSKKWTKNFDDLFKNNICIKEKLNNYFKNLLKFICTIIIALDKIFY